MNINIELLAESYKGLTAFVFMMKNGGKEGRTGIYNFWNSEICNSWLKQISRARKVL